MLLWRTGMCRSGTPVLRRTGAPLLTPHRSTASSFPSSPSSASTVPLATPSASPLRVQEDSPPGAAARDENFTRLRELLQEAGPQHSNALFPHLSLPRRREVWPTSSPPPELPSSSSPSPSVPSMSTKAGAAQYRSAEAIRALQSPSTAVSEQDDAFGPLRWYGPPPGVVQDVDYFTSTLAAEWNTHFHTRYYLNNKPTAPLLRCPACAEHVLRCEAAKDEKGSVSADASARQSSASLLRRSSRLWLDPPAMDRHLSWAHADQLYTPQEFAAYNDQVLAELMHACGLTAAPPRHTTARLVVAVDVANLELALTRNLLDLLTLKDVRRSFSQVPVAFCATHEVFLPFSSKVLHVLYQLALLHPASTLHVFAANTSMESGDLMTAHYLNELLLTSASRAVPPIVLLTRDGQQRQVAQEMHGIGQRTASPLGVVRCASTVSLPYLLDEIRAALTSGLWTV